jgi:hypothetical protein
MNDLKFTTAGDYMKETEQDNNDTMIAQLIKDRDQLKEKCEKLSNILAKLFPEKSGHYFICGESGEKDQSGLPQLLLVCPQYGLDGFATYKLDREYSAPEW